MSTTTFTRAAVPVLILAALAAAFLAVVGLPHGTRIEPLLLPSALAACVVAALGAVSLPPPPPAPFVA